MKLIALAGMVIAYFITASTMAADYKAGSIAINDSWSRATPKGAQSAIGYMTIKNNSTTPDRLIGGSVDVANSFQFHSMVLENGIAKMRDLSGIDIRPGQTIEFKPGGSHAMLENLKHPLSKGEYLKGTLTFEHAGNGKLRDELLNGEIFYSLKEAPVVIEQ